MIDQFVIPLLKIVVVLNATLVGVTYMVLLERKVIAWAQSRLGPMRVGPYGVLQPVADAIKLMLKEDITPVKADKWVFTAAPIISMVPALIVYAVIPFGPVVKIFGHPVSLFITDINVGLLYIVSVASVGVYGIILAGYASNSKYPLLASLRASAQLISYEVAVTLTLVSVILMAGSLSMVSIVNAQYNADVWFVFVQPLAFVIFFIGSLAETNRAPFDMPEAEQELTGGFHTEYSGMRFALFFLAEYANMIVVSSVATTLFLGGWLRPFPNVAALHFLDVIPSWTWFLIKSFVFLYIFIWVRATLPRYRYDQLMRLGWKVLIPLAIVNLVVTGIVQGAAVGVMVQAIAFYFIAACILGFAVLVVSTKDTVHSVLFLVLDFLFVSALYVMLGAQFLAAIQVLVYAGGIVVLYLFVVMLVNLKRPPEAHQDPHRRSKLGFGLAGAVLAEFAVIVAYGYARPSQAIAATASMPVTGNTEQVGWLLYTSYLIPFEIASMLLLVAMIGAIVLAKRNYEFRHLVISSSGHR